MLNILTSWLPAVQLVNSPHASPEMGFGSDLNGQSNVLHQKSKSGVVLAPEKDMCPPKTFSKITQDREFFFVFAHFERNFVIY